LRLGGNSNILQGKFCPVEERSKIHERGNMGFSKKKIKISNIQFINIIFISSEVSKAKKINVYFVWKKWKM
jgi:hypothetical protein